MTREEAKELLPIIQAWAEGKSIQFQTDSGSWSNITKDLYPCNHPSLYRIKPEPRYRPFKTREECWNEMHKHPDFGWVKVNVTCEYEQIVRICDYRNTELTFNIANNDDVYTSEMMLNIYIFTDGTPFGSRYDV